jgi:hypothetical protein
MLFFDEVVWQVGERGQIYTSRDLDNWIPRESGTTKSLRSLTTFGTNIFISAEEGTILFGPNARELTIRTLGTTDWLEGIAGGTNSIVAVGDNGAIYSSANGVDWDRRGDFTTWLRSVAYGGGQFVTVGEDGFIATSPDGESWHQRTSDTIAHLNKVAWLEDRFWIVGDEGTVLTNSSPTTFSMVNLPLTNTLYTVSANTNEVMIAGDGIVLLSTHDGGLWVRQSDPGTPLLAPEWIYYSSIWDGRLFLLSGESGMLVEGFRTNSTAPLYWYSTIQPTRSWLWSVAHVDDFYTAVGVNGTIVTSDDGAEWFREATPVESETEVLLGIGGNTNVLVAAGSRGLILTSENLLTNIVSTNLLGEVVTNAVSLFGVNWNTILSGVTNDLQGVAATSDLLIVTGGSGTILTSSGAGMGRIWVSRSSGVSAFLSGATAWPGGFVSTGAAGTIQTSPDGITWTQRNSGVVSWIYAVRYVGGQLVAVGEGGLILTSSDGVEWQTRVSGTSEWLNDVTYAQGTWYVTAGNGTLVTSSDGVLWRPERAITSRSLYGAATDGEQVIAVGMEGMILRRNLRVETEPVQILSYENPGLSSIFLFAGKVDQRFVLEEADSVLGPWRPAAFLELTEPSGTMVFERPNNDAPMKFFRTRLL